MIALTSTDDEILAEMERVRVLYKLKYTMRYESARDMRVHSESVAEHLFAMQIISQYFLPLEDAGGKLDRVRINELILFHEIGEIETGDILNSKKTDQHRAIEREAAERVAESLPESMRALALERFHEFEQAASREAVFVQAVDKIEPLFELWDEQLALPLFKKHGIMRNVALDNKREATTTFPYMRRFLEAWDSRAMALDTFPVEPIQDRIAR